MKELLNNNGHQLYYIAILVVVTILLVKAKLLPEAEEGLKRGIQSPYGLPEQKSPFYENILKPQMLGILNIQY